jgi:hypothetical protein
VAPLTVHPTANPFANRTTCGGRPPLIATGVAPLGIISIGIVPMGVVAIGVVPMGVMSFGAVAMGVVSAGAVSMGVLTAGVTTMGVWWAGVAGHGPVRLNPPETVPIPLPVERGGSRPPDLNPAAGVPHPHGDRTVHRH